VQAEGKAFLDVYLVIEDISSYKMTETSGGVYEYNLDGSMFDWETTYLYHFSDREGGPDMAPLVSGMIITPLEPEPDDPITDVDINEEDDGSWVVDVIGAVGQTLYIVIEDVGSFLLEEVVNGTYRVLIPGDNFDEGEVYNYYFSNTTDGADISPGNSGSYTTEDGTSSSSGSDFNPFLCCGVVLVVLLLLIILIIVVIVIASRGKDDEEDWGEE
jgi:hypothetical protein